MSKADKWRSEEGINKIKQWVKKGLSSKQIASNIGISRSTLYEWKKKYKDISDTLESGKEIIEEVENALLKKALGYRYKEEQAIKLKEVYYDDKGNKCQKETVTIISVEKEIQPDTTAIKFWLVNKAKNQWNDNPSKLDLDRENFELRKKEIEGKTI